MIDHLKMILKTMYYIIMLWGKKDTKCFQYNCTYINLYYRS